MHIILIPLVKLISTVMDLLVFALIIQAVLSWLTAFDVLNSRSPLVHTVLDTLYRLTEPLLRPIRRRLPQTGTVDLAPLVLILVLYFLQNVLQQLLLSGLPSLG